MFWLELLVVLAALALGARLGGIFLGIAGVSALPSSSLFLVLLPPLRRLT